MSEVDEQIARIDRVAQPHLGAVSRAGRSPARAAAAIDRQAARPDRHRRHRDPDRRDGDRLVRAARHRRRAAGDAAARRGDLRAGGDARRRDPRDQARDARQVPLKALPLQDRTMARRAAPERCPRQRARLVDGIGKRLETLAPATGDARRERRRRRAKSASWSASNLPELVEGYARVPAPLRTVARNGKTPDAAACRRPGGDRPRDRAR